MSRYSPQALEELLHGALDVARRAAGDIMAIYAGGFEVEQKSDLTPLTAADMASHRRLEAELAPLDPAALVLTEESSPERFALRHAARRLWLVDPLDGTREFVKRNGEFCINVALVEDGIVCLGLLLHPPTGSAWYAWRDSGAFRLNPGAQAQAVTVRQPCPEVPRAAASRSFGNAAVESYLNALGTVERIPQGSALKFGRIAEGSCDIYARLASRCSEWDVAAGQCIVEQAGGRVLDEHGRPLRYNQREHLTVHNFLAFGDADRAWLEALRGIALDD